MRDIRSIRAAADGRGGGVGRRRRVHRPVIASRLGGVAFASAVRRFWQRAPFLLLLRLFRFGRRRRNGRGWRPATPPESHVLAAVASASANRFSGANR